MPGRRGRGVSRSAVSVSLTGETLAAPERTPCLANSPSATSTWQRPQMPRPPQTESTSTPSVRAAERSGVPTGKRPRLPEGVKTTSGSLRGHGSPLRRGTRYARGLRPRSRRPRPASPSAPGGGASRKRAIQRSQCGSWPIMTSAPRQAWTVSTCSGFVIAEVRPEAIAMVRKALLMPPRFGRPKLTLEAPQVVLTLSSLVQPPHEAHHLHARQVDGADRHHQRVDDDVARRDAVVRGALDDALGDREAHVRVLGDAGLVVLDRDHGRAVLLDERQDRLEALLLAGDGVHQRLALVDGEARPRAPRRSTSRSTAARR